MPALELQDHWIGKVMEVDAAVLGAAAPTVQRQQKQKHLGKGNNMKRKRVMAEEDDFIHSEDDDQENDEDNDQEIEYIDSSSESDEDDLPRQVDEETPMQVDGNLETCRSGRQAKKLKDVNSLYY